MKPSVGPTNYKMDIHLARNLQRLLQDHKITASALSRVAGVPTTTLSNWIAGQSPKNIQQVYQVSQYFGLSIEELVFDRKPLATETPDPLRDLNSEIHAGVYEVVLRKSNGGKKGDLA